MLFNPANFAIFFSIVNLLYWGVFRNNFRFQNILLLISSYYFYANWDWRFLFLLVFSTVLDFYTGVWIHKSESVKVRTIWLWLSIGINLGFLGVFKYFNFFINLFKGYFTAVDFLGSKSNKNTLALNNKITSYRIVLIKAYGFDDQQLAKNIFDSKLWFAINQSFEPRRCKEVYSEIITYH